MSFFVCHHRAIVLILQIMSMLNEANQLNSSGQFICATNSNRSIDSKYGFAALVTLTNHFLCTFSRRMPIVSHDSILSSLTGAVVSPSKQNGYYCIWIESLMKPNVHPCSIKWATYSRQDKLFYEVSQLKRSWLVSTHWWADIKNLCHKNVSVCQHSPFMVHSNFPFHRKIITFRRECKLDSPTTRANKFNAFYEC